MATDSGTPDAAVSKDDQPYRDRRMSLADHLTELRRRLMIAAVALVVGMIVAFVVTDPVIWVLTEPIRIVDAQRGGDGTAVLNFDSVTSGFDMRLRISFSIGLLVSAPIWLWQIWAYVMPGLTRREVRYTIGFVASAIPLFFGGCVVAWYLLPHIIELMAGFVPQQAALFYKYDYYYDFVFKLLLALGVAFVLPVFVVALNLAGIISGREILRGWRVAVLVATIFAATTTPVGDITSMLVLAGIFVVLYFAAVGVALLFDRRKRKREKALLEETT